MKYIIILAVIYTAISSTVSLEQPAIRVGERLFDKELRALLERFREIIPVGIEEKGIPILDPLKLDGINVAMDLKDVIAFVVNMTNFKLSGLEQFKTNIIKLSLLGTRMDFDITIPKAVVEADHYIIDGILEDLLNITGEGRFLMISEDLRMKGNASISIKDWHATMKDFKIVLSASKMHFNIEGILGGDFNAIVINRVLEDLFPILLKTEEHHISRLIGTKVMALINPYLETLTLEEIIAIITGKKPFDTDIASELLQLII